MNNRSHLPKPASPASAATVIGVRCRGSAIVIVERGHQLVEAATSSLPVMAFSAGRAGT
jgi:hypothetical protein